MNSELVSIIMPLYNAEKYVLLAIESVQKQTYKNWELLICDDHSTDNGYKLVLEAAKKDPRIKVFQTISNGGSSVARNEALRHANGKYIGFLDSDDLYKESFIEKQIIFSKEHGPFVFSSYDRMASKSYTTWFVRKKQNIKGCCTGDDISCLTAFYDASALGKIYFDETLIMNEDSMYWIDLLKKTEWAYGNPESLAIYRIVKKSKSKNKIKSAKYMWMLYRKRLGINPFTSLWYLFRMTIYSLHKYSNVK